MKFLLRLAILAVAVYVLYWMFASTLQRSLIYFPSTASENELDRLAADSDFERWTTPDGRPIGWQSRFGNPLRPVLILHGNAGFALHRAALAQRLHQAAPELHAKYYLLEYPGYGDRPGTPSQNAFVDAAEEALATLATSAKTILVGESIGTGVATLATEKLPQSVAGLVLITPFDSLVSVAKFHYPWLPVGWILSDRFESLRALKNFPGPVAFLVAGADEITPAKAGMRLYDSYPGQKRLWLVEGARHNNVATRISAKEWAEILGFASEGVLPEER